MVNAKTISRGVKFAYKRKSQFEQIAFLLRRCSSSEA